MKTETSKINPDTLIVSVDAGEFMCDGGKVLPYPTWIGTVSKSTGRVRVWTPSASVPRGYHSAARRALEEIAERTES